ncbi:PREDICTED: S-type anion channel SLAH3 [Tarenaya hassleriana]|uniref:S-type anion channel SLAH3 n=1 Tax=Tarenaya hassleriana TaxID=28532 RepID=UPI00053C6E24|nr:PREDICTED: S-type anion channel SLAH3 [Tarenaya hassleriana]
MEEKDWAIQVEGKGGELPTLLRKVTEEEMVGFDSVMPIDNGWPMLHHHHHHHHHHQDLSRFHPFNASGVTDQEPSRPAMEANNQEKEDTESPPLMINHQRKQSISMPSSPLRLLEHLETAKPNVLVPDARSSSSDIKGFVTKSVKFLSQPMPRSSTFFIENGHANGTNHHDHHQNDDHHRHHDHGYDHNPAMRRLKDNRYNSFKTWSGKLERQFTRKPARAEPDEDDGSNQNVITNEAMPVDRYYDALEGPELETLRPQEEIVLPDDKTWPFLLRYPISSFGMCLGVSSQAIMWKTLATAEPTKFLHVPLWINQALWFISVGLILVIACIYSLKVLLYFEAVRREYYHPIRVNFFFAPFISLLFLALGVPPSVIKDLPQTLWYILMFPFLCLELKIYGQWMSGGQRRLSRVANPTNHLSIVGNFVGALLGASMGLKEGPIFFYAVGMAHYLVLFVTLYQRLPTNETLPKELHPVFFLFVAAPSVASMAWAKISGSFDSGSKICYFIALFLYFSLAVRINFFRGIKFSLAWWAYTFPMTGAAIATIRYATVVKTPVTQILCVVLSAVATLVVTALLVTTILYAFVLRNLFPNDIAIAISDRPRPKQQSHHHHRWLNHLKNASSENIEHYLKFTDSSDSQNDLEASNGDSHKDLEASNHSSRA